MCNIHEQAREIELLIQELKKYLETLHTMPVLATPMAFAAQAQSNKFPVDISRRLMLDLNILNDMVTQNVSTYIEQRCIPYLEVCLADFNKVIEETENLK